MQEYRPDRVVGVLTTLITIAFYGLVGVAALVLIAAPALKLFAAGDREWGGACRYRWSYRNPR